MTSNFLSEEDIPGASLHGRNPATLKGDELRFWLKCRGDSLKGLKTKAQLVKRIEEYIKAGRDKNIVDPDANKIYTRRKEKQNSSQSTGDRPQIPIKYPTNGWSTKLERMPLFTRAEMNLHVSQSGKNIASVSKNHSVPTSMRKGKTFLEDEYLKDVLAASDTNYFYFKALCHHSYRKNDDPHHLKLALCLLTGKVQHAFCSCVAGSVGFCNHILGLMMKLCKLSLYDCKDIKELNQEEDMSPPIACTSSLQMWHRTGRGIKIHAKPIMEVNVKKTKLDNKLPFESGLKCLLYEARKYPKQDTAKEVQLQNSLRAINPNMGLAQIMNPVAPSCIDTKFGKAQPGSYSSYQLQFTESNFSVCCDLEVIPRQSVLVPQDTGPYPDFPLKPTQEYKKPVGLEHGMDNLLDFLIVDKIKLNKIEKETREQSASEEWKNERKYRFTASNFKTIFSRQRNHNTLVNNLLHPKPFSTRHTIHGHTYEPIALREYEKYMFSIRKQVLVLKSGLVVCMELPLLGASPDGKVLDVGCVEPYGIVEVKCPSSKFLVTPFEACSDNSFFAEAIGGTPKLKRSHQYYYQVQAQMGTTRAEWCDFVIYTNIGMSIERIEFDPQFWDTMKTKLNAYYLEHFIKAAAEEYAKNRVD